MSHHSQKHPLTEMLPEERKELIKTLETNPAEELKKKLEAATEQIKQLDDTLGPTGTYPAGRIVPHDEGGLMFGVTVFNGRVIIDFGKPIRSIGFTRNDALQLAKILTQRAKMCPPIIGKPDPEGS